MDELHERLHMAAGKVSFRQIGTLTSTHPETVRRYMQGQAPSVGFVVRFADAFDVGIEWLLTGRGVMRPVETPAQGLPGVSLDTPLDRPSESETSGRPIHSGRSGVSVELKQSGEAVAAEVGRAARSPRPIDDIRRRLAERRRTTENQGSGGHYDAA